MSIFRARGVIFLAAALLILAGVACGQLGLPQDQPTAPAILAQAPTSEVTAVAAESTILPTETAIPETVEPAATEPATVAPATAEPATAEPTAAATATADVSLPTPVPTRDPHHVVITESDIASVIEAGAGSDSGAQAQGLAVHFAGGKTSITADSVSYGMFTVSGLAVTGVLVARDGVLQLDAESVSPQGLVGAMAPGLINQALRQYTSRWYVEDVQTLDGRIELRVR